MYFFIGGMLLTSHFYQNRSACQRNIAFFDRMRTFHALPSARKIHFLACAPSRHGLTTQRHEPENLFHDLLYLCVHDLRFLLDGIGICIESLARPLEGQGRPTRQCFLVFDQNQSRHAHRQRRETFQSRLDCRSQNSAHGHSRSRHECGQWKVGDCPHQRPRTLHQRTHHRCHGRLRRATRFLHARRSSGKGGGIGLIHTPRYATSGTPSASATARCICHSSSLITPSASTMVRHKCRI
jgi:hypothetical protein